MKQNTIPPLDNETERINFDPLSLSVPNTIRQKIDDVLENNKALQLRHFSPGQGEEWYYILSINSDTCRVITPPHVSIEKRHSVSDLLDKDSLKDIYLIPIERCPVVGDGSIHYSCYECGQPIIEEERVYQRDPPRFYHEYCLNEN